MRLLVPARRGPDSVEAMDAGEGSPAEVAEAYRRLDEINRRLGGHRLTDRALDLAFDAVATELAGPLAVLDVAGGDGAFARHIAAWGAERGRGVDATVLERHPVALSALAGDGGMAAVRADALRLPFAERAVDLAHCSCFFHHLSTSDARDLLAELCRVSRRAVVVNDLVRSWVAAAGIRVIAGAWGNRLIRADGPISVLKSFRPDEFLALAHAVSATDAPTWRWRVLETFPYRMALLGVRLSP